MKPTDADLRIKARLIFVLGLLFLLVAGDHLHGPVGINKANDALMTAYKEHAVSIVQIVEIQCVLLRNRLTIAVSQLHEDCGKAHLLVGPIERRSLEVRVRSWS